MSYRAIAVSLKSRGGKGSKGVALFSHKAEATVHLVENGDTLCGIDKPAKKAWTLKDHEAKRGSAKRWGWNLTVCKNCQTHL